MFFTVKSPSVYRHESIAFPQKHQHFSVNHQRQAVAVTVRENSLKPGSGSLAGDGHTSREVELIGQPEQAWNFRPKRHVDMAEAEAGDGDVCKAC